MRRETSHVMFLLPSLSGGGAEKVILQVASSVPSDQSSLAVLTREGEWNSKVPENLSVYEFGQKRARNSIFRIAKFFSQSRPPIIVSTLAYFNFIVMIAVKISRHVPKRTILREANTPSATLRAFPLKIIGKFLYRWAYNKATCVICNSEQVKNELIEIGVQERIVRVIPNPVDIDAIRALAKEPVRYDKAIDPALPLFVFVGRLTKQKGVDELIQSISIMRSEISLLIIGNGEERAFLEDLTEKMNLQDRVHFLGFCSNPYPYMRLSKALILPSRWEGLPNAGLESLALNTPVIATRTTGGLTELSRVVKDSHLIFVNSNQEMASVLDNFSMLDQEFNNSDLSAALPLNFDKHTVLLQYREAIFGE